MPGGTFSEGLAVNDSGQVVGFSDTATGAAHAFLYSNGRMLGLNDFIPSDSGFTLVSVMAGINDGGQITGFGTTSAGATHAFLLTPVPEPASLVLLSLDSRGSRTCVPKPTPL